MTERQSAFKLPCYTNDFCEDATRAIHGIVVKEEGGLRIVEYTGDQEIYQTGVCDLCHRNVFWSALKKDQIERQ